jgi:hypothetical protein
MVGGQYGENGVSVPELVEVDGVKERETLPTLNLITSVRGKSTRIIFIMTWNVAKHKTVHVGIISIWIVGWVVSLDSKFSVKHPHCLITFI